MAASPTRAPVKNTNRKRPAAATAPSRYDAFLTGELLVEDLDMEELLKGQIRDIHGQFRGRPSAMIPRQFHTKVVQELLQRAEGKWREHMEEAMEVFVEIMNDPRKPAQFRLQAAQYVFERIAGKIPDKQVVEATVKRWEDVAEAVMVEIIDDTTEYAEIVDQPAIEAPKPPRRPTRPKKESAT